MYVPTAYIINALNLLQETDARYKASKNKRLMVEMTLIKLCYLGNAIKLAGDEDDGITDVKKKSVKPVAQYVKPEPVSVPKAEIAPKEIATPKTIVDKTEPKPENKTEVIEKTGKPDVANVLGGLSQFRKSIKAETKQEKQEEETEEFSADTYPSINSSAFIDAVKKLDSFLTEQKKYLLKPLMLQFPPRLNDSKKIEIAVSSEVNYTKLIEEKDFIAEYFRKTLGVEKVWLEVKLNKEQKIQEAVATKPYSATDRFKYLVAKNSKLQELRDKLKLDIE